MFNVGRARNNAASASDLCTDYVKDSSSADVVVIIPTFRRLNFLRSAVDSVERAAERFGERVDVIVCDDAHEASTRDYCTSASFKRCRVFYVLPSEIIGAGPSIARAAGVASSAAPYIFLLDDDDEFLANRFEVALPLLRSGVADVVLEVSRRDYCDGSHRQSFLTGPGVDSTGVDPFAYLIEGGEESHVAPAATSFTRGIYDSVGGWNSKLRFGEDGEFLLRLCAVANVTLKPGAEVSRVRIHQSNTTHADALAVWQNVKSLTVLYRWLVARKMVNHAQYIEHCLSAKLDYGLTLSRRESGGWCSRITSGVKCIRYFPLRCFKRNNFRSLVVWLFYPKTR